MKHASIIAAACAALVGGCVKQEYQTNARVNDDPLVIDEAMQLREWDKSHANYENGSTKNWSTGFGYASRGDIPPYGPNYLVDLGTFVTNVLTLPVTAFNERDGVVSSGVNVPESYTAVPPVPPRYRPTGQGVGPQDNGLGNDQGGGQNSVNTVGNPDAAQNNALNSTVTGNRSDNNSTNGGRSNSNGGTNTNTASDAANADTSSGGTSGSGGKSRNSGSATGSGAGGSSGAGGGAGGK